MTLLSQDLSLCTESERLYQNITFPKTCNTCEKIFYNRSQFIDETLSLIKGSYSKGTRGKIFEYRNCNCGSTLVCPVESQRDNSPQGDLRRLEFDRQVTFLLSNGIEKVRAIEMTREKFKNKKSIMLN